MAIAQNRLIELLPRKDRSSLLADCEPVQLTLGDVLSEPGKPTSHVYFPTDCFISLVTFIDGRPGLEVAMVGCEGMLGIQLVAGVSTAPTRAQVQGSGAAWRIGSIAFRRQLAHSAALQRVLNRYLCVLMDQLATSATCLRFHLIGPRLARWLLMSQDRAHADNFHVTHEVLAHMLGVRRVGITVAAGALHRSGLIEYRRGDVRVLDRTKLEAQACGCYAIDRRTYAELMPTTPEIARAPHVKVSPH